MISRGRRYTFCSEELTVCVWDIRKYWSRGRYTETIQGGQKPWEFMWTSLLFPPCCALCRCRSQPIPHTLPQDSATTAVEQKTCVCCGVDISALLLKCALTETIYYVSFSVLLTNANWQESPVLQGSLEWIRVLQMLWTAPASVWESLSATPSSNLLPHLGGPSGSEPSPGCPKVGMFNERCLRTLQSCW